MKYSSLKLFFVCFLGVVYHGDRAITGTADAVHKLKKLVRIIIIMRTLSVCLSVCQSACSNKCLRMAEHNYVINKKLSCHREVTQLYLLSVVTSKMAPLGRSCVSYY